MEVIEHRPSAPETQRPEGPGAIERWLDRPAIPRAILAGSLLLTAAAWWAARTFSGADAQGGAWTANLVAVCGLTIDLLLFWSIVSLVRRKAQFADEAQAAGAQAQGRLASLTAISGLSPDAVLVFERGDDGLHRLAFTNPAFSDWFGLRPDDLLGLSEAAVDEWLAGLAGAEPMPPLARGDAAVTLGAPVPRILRRGMREDGRQRVYYFRDVTHESEVERLKNEFLTTAAHELRTPLASVYGFAELLQIEGISADKRQRAAAVVYRQAGVLKHLVDELLDLARIDSRRGQDFARRPEDLRTVVEAAIESTSVPDLPHRVAAALPGAPVRIDGDAARLRQAIANVIGNALKYSAPESTVTVSLGCASGDAQDWATLQVADRGIGMNAADCARAFERFFRADASGHVLGAGLGLAIVKEIVELHGGSVTLASTPGEGTTVTLRLPLLASAPQPLPEPAAALADA